jgi:hypothetical protein
MESSSEGLIRLPNKKPAAAGFLLSTVNFSVLRVGEKALGVGQSGCTRVIYSL